MIGVGSMTTKEVDEFITHCACGVVTVLDGEKPYSVVLEHYYNGKDLYFGVSANEDQRKLKCIRENPNAAFMVYESRREKPEMIKQGIMCRSVLVEGKLIECDVKSIEKASGTIKLKLLKLEPESISNWVCPRKRCHAGIRWYDRYPELIADLT